VTMLVLFDLNGTLLDPAGIGEPWGASDLGAGVLSEAVQGAMVDTLSGAFRPLDEHVRAALLREVAVRGLDPAHVDAALERAQSLDPFPDAAAALATLRAAGHRVAVLTNSARATGERALARAGLEVEAVIGADEVQAYKPHPAPYRHAVQRLGDAMLAAAHWWDVTGAKRAGLRTAWIARGEGELTPAAPEPDVRARDLADLAAQLSVSRSASRLV
jgi:2-haloacid dehalogenase